MTVVVIIDPNERDERSNFFLILDKLDENSDVNYRGERRRADTVAFTLV